MRITILVLAWAFLLIHGFLLITGTTIRESSLAWLVIYSGWFIIMIVFSLLVILKDRKTQKVQQRQKEYQKAVSTAMYFERTLGHDSPKTKEQWQEVERLGLQ